MQKDEKQQISTKRVFSFYWQYASRYKFLVSFIVFGAILSSTAALVQPWFMKNLINGLTTNQELGLIYYTLFLMILFGAIESLAWRISGYTVSKFQPKVMSDLQTGGFNYVLNHSYQFFSDNFTGSLVKKINRVSRSFERISDEFQFRFIPSTIILVGSFIGLFLRNLTVALIFLAWVVIFIYFNYVATKYKLKIDIERSKIDSKATGHLSDALTNSITAKLFNGYEYEKKRYAQIMSQWNKLFTKGWLFAEKIYLVQNFIFIFFEAAMLIYSVNLWHQGVLTVGDIVLFQTYFTIVVMRVWDIGRGMRNLYEGIAESKEMIELVDLPYDVKDIPKAAKLKVTKGLIEFVDAGFNYNETRVIFKNLNLAIKPGEKVALIGASGAGKSTITKLLFRFYELTSGKILIDGQNISKVTQDSLRANISLVPQEPILFHRSLMENIRYGRLGASDKEVFAAAKKARCHDFILTLPQGYDTFVGERGVKLSGGERQRVAIARAILKNAPILVLDEATSSLDSESEQLIQVALKELMKGKTTIVIAHRLSTIMQMDRIIVIEEGKVVDQGSHQELLKRQGIYKKLWEIQAGGFLLDEE